MNYPFEKTKSGYPILDTEEKLQWFMNRLLHREVDLYEVNAVVIDLDSVWLKRRETLCCQKLNVNGAEPSLMEPTIFAKVDPSVVPVLRAIHASRDAAMEQRRKELGEKARAFRTKRIETEKEIKNTFCGLALSILRTKKEQNND